MKRKLLRQLLNEWRSNLWLGLELLIVSVIIWYIADFLFVKVSILTEPSGWGSLDGMYRVEVTSIPADSPDFKKIEDESNWWETYAADHRSLLERLRTNPDVEFAAILGSGGSPYDGSWSSGSLKDANPLPGDTINIESLNFNADDEEEAVPATGRKLNRYVFMVDVPKGGLKMFDVHGLNGETPDQLEEILDRGDLIISATAVNGTGRDPLSLIGREFYRNSDTTRVKRIGAVIPYLNSQGDYTGIGDHVKVMERDDQGWGSMVIKVRPGAEKGFVDRIMAEADNYYRVNNMVIDNVQALREISEEYNREHRIEMRNWFVCLGFLLLTTFLGVLGTFWFRTQQRMGEMAIRKAFGANRGNLFRRLIGEGLLILACATVPAAVIDFVLARYELNNELYLIYLEPARMAITIGATFLILALMIVLGTLFPAWRAMKVEPARVLADE